MMPKNRAQKEHYKNLLNQWNQFKRTSAWKWHIDEFESYLCLKLAKHTKMVTERVIDQCISGTDTPDVIFVMRQMPKKQLVKHQNLCIAFTELEKTYNDVSKKVI